MGAMPMFPLGTVLLPGAVLPLHVFEPRYRQMVRDCVDAPQQEFGVVLIGRGSEVGGGDTRLDVGTVARLLQVAPLSGDRFALLTVGTRRILIDRWLPDDPYPRADVTDWPDPEALGQQAELAERIAAAAGRARQCAGLAVELGDRTGVPQAELTGDVSLDSFVVAGISPLGPADQYAVLSAPDVPTRLDVLDGLLDDVEAALRFRLG